QTLQSYNCYEDEPLAHAFIMVGVSIMVGVRSWWGSGLSIDLSVSKHGGQSFIFANIVDFLMPTINMMPRIETTLLDDYCGAGGIAFSLTDGLNRQRAPQQHWHARH
ncbi:MAG: hypothetical protein U1E51_04525, partial [Candidatus Binatia bacterium]|nr:hypothetical protein [Candidatus Binatia bacterium]